MGLLDKVKAQGDGGQRAGQGCGAEGPGQVDEVQSKKAADGILRDLGAAFYATKTGRDTPHHRSRHRPTGGRHLRPTNPSTASLTLAPESAAAAPTAYPPPTAGSAGLPPASTAVLTDAARLDHSSPTSPGRRWPWIGWPRPVYTDLLRRGVEQSGSSSGS